MQRSNAATRRFYSAFYRWSILNSKPALSHRAAPGLHRNKSDIRKRVEGSSRLNKISSDGRGIRVTTEAEDKGDAQEDGGDAQGKALAASVKSRDSQESGSKHAHNFLRNAPLRPSQDHPFETIKPGQFAVRFRSDAGLMIEVPLPRDQLSVAQENFGQDLERVSELTKARLEVRPGLSPTGENSQDLMSVLVSGPYESVRRAYRSLTQFDKPSRNGKAQDVPQTGLTNRISVAARLPIKTTEELASSSIPPWHLAVRSRSGNVMTVEYCMPWEAWASFSAARSVDDVSTSTGAKVEAGGSYVRDGTGPQSGEMTRCVLLSGNLANLRRAQACFSASGPRMPELEAQETVKRPQQDIPKPKFEPIVVERLIVPRGLRKHIFGQGGKILQGIRQESGCGRMMFRNGAGNEPENEYLRIQGTRPQINAAKAHVQRNFDRACTYEGLEMVRVSDMVIREGTFVMPRTYWARVKLPHGTELAGWVKGTNAEKFKRMEKDDDCQISKTTAPNSPDAIILIVGPKSAVKEVMKKLQVLVDQGCARDGLAAAKIEVLEESEAAYRQREDTNTSRENANGPLSKLSTRAGASAKSEGERAHAEVEHDKSGENDARALRTHSGRFLVASVSEMFANSALFGQYEVPLNQKAVELKVGLAPLDPPIKGQRFFYMASEVGSEKRLDAMLMDMRQYVRAFEKRTEQEPAELSIVQRGRIDRQGRPLDVSAEIMALYTYSAGGPASATGSENQLKAKPIKEAKLTPGFDAGRHRTLKQYNTFMIVAVPEDRMPPAMEAPLPGFLAANKLGRAEKLQRNSEGKTLFYLQAHNFNKLQEMRDKLQNPNSLPNGEFSELEVVEMGEELPTVVDLPVALEMSRLERLQAKRGDLSSRPDNSDSKSTSPEKPLASTRAHKVPVVHQQAALRATGIPAQPSQTRSSDSSSGAEDVAPSSASNSTVPNEHGNSGIYTAANAGQYTTPHEDPPVDHHNAASMPFGLPHHWPGPRVGDTEPTTRDISPSVVSDISGSKTFATPSLLSAQEVKELTDSMRAALKRLSQYEKQQVTTSGVPEESISKMMTAVPASSAQQNEKQSLSSSMQKAQSSVEPLRTALRRLTHPVVVVTARIPSPKGEKGDQHVFARGVTVSSFNAVTFSPRPVISFNIKIPSRTWDAMGLNVSICAHILAASPEGAAIAHAFTQPYEEAHEPFVRIRTAGATVQVSTGSTPPKIKSWGAVLARVHAHIRTAQCVTVGDHVIVVADVYSVQTGDADDPDDAVALAYGMKGYRAPGESLQPLELLGDPNFTPLNPKILYPPTATEAMSADGQEEIKQVDAGEQTVDVSRDTHTSETPALLAEEDRAYERGTAGSATESAHNGEETQSAAQIADPKHTQAAAESIGQGIDRQEQQVDLDSETQDAYHESNLWEAMASEPEEDAEEQDPASSAAESVKQDPAAAEEHKTEDQTHSQVQNNDAEEDQAKLTEAVVPQTEHDEKSAEIEAQPANEARESEYAETPQTTNAESQDTGDAGSSSKPDFVTVQVDSREVGEPEAQTSAEPTAGPTTSEERPAPDRASAALPDFKSPPSQPEAHGNTAKHAAPNAWGLPNSTRAYTTSTRLSRSYSTKTSPDESPIDPTLLKTTVEDYLCPPHNLGPRLKPRLRAKQAAEQATRRLSLALSDGTLTPEESAELETTITVNERRVAKGIALRSAIDLSAMLDKGNVDPRRVGFWETSVERGQAVLLEEAKEARRKFDRLEMSGRDFQAVKQQLEGEYEKYNSALVRLRESADEDDD